MFLILLFFFHFFIDLLSELVIDRKAEILIWEKTTFDTSVFMHYSRASIPSELTA